jgi:hypothetical protein
MKIYPDNGDSDFVHCRAESAEAAREDQSIDGNKWEFVDGTYAYAMLCDRKSLVADLKKEGYDVNTDEYWEPDDE